MPNNLPVARLLAHLDLHNPHGGGGGGAIFLKQYEQRINDPLHTKEKTVACDIFGSSSVIFS